MFSNNRYNNGYAYVTSVVISRVPSDRVVSITSARAPSGWEGMLGGRGGRGRLGASYGTVAITFGRVRFGRTRNVCGAGCNERGLWWGRKGWLRFGGGGCGYSDAHRHLLWFLSSFPAFHAVLHPVERVHKQADQQPHAEPDPRVRVQLHH